MIEQNQLELANTANFFVIFFAPYKHCALLIADVAISKRPLLFTVWTQLRLRGHQNFYEIFTRKKFFANFCG